MDEIKSVGGIGTSHSKQVEFILFFAIWDEELGPEVLEFCPRSSILDLESLASSVFATYQYFWNKADEQYQKTKVTLPVVNLNRKAHVLLEVTHNPEVRGGVQPFIVVLLVPDYIMDKDLEVYDVVLSKISKKYINEQEMLVKEGYGETIEIYSKEQEIQESTFEISEYYSYTAAVEDFRAGVQLFQTKNYDGAYPMLRKALMKFEQENHKNLIMEAVYLLASLFAQKKQFSTAEEYYLRLELLAEELAHQKYNEISIFMSGFCAYKNERYIEAIQQFSKIELFKKQFINEFQYQTMYGRALEKLQNYEESIKKLRSADRIIKSMEQTLAIKKQQGQIKYELGLLYYRLAIENTKRKGIENQENFKEILTESIDFFEQSAKIWKKIEDNTQIIKTYSLIGDIFEFLGDDTKFLEYYSKALKIAEKSEDLGNQIKILKRIIQKQAILGEYDKNIKNIREILEKFEDYKLFDLHTAANLHRHLGISLVKTDQIEEGLTELIKAFDILDKFKNPVDDELLILNRILILCNKLKNKEKTDYYSKKREEVSEKLKAKELKESKEVKQLGILKDIWVFSKTIGIELFSYSLETKVESDLIGGFMTAIQALSEQVAYKNIDSMIFGDDRFTIYQEEDRDIYILARSSAKFSEDIVEKTLSTIYNRFWKEFHEEIVDFEGNITPFRKFTKIIESFDWTLVSMEADQLQAIARKRIIEKRAEMRQLAQAIPDGREALPVDGKAIPTAEELKARAKEKREQLMKTPMFLDDLKEEEITEEDVQVFKEKRICLVHKGPIEGYIFMCPECAAFYCIKCVDALIEIENFCWNCNSALDPNKPTQRDDSKEEEDEPAIGEDIIEEGEILEKASKTEAIHKAPKTDAIHKAPKTDAIHKAPKGESIHKAPKTDAIHKAPKGETMHKGPKEEHMDKEQTKSTLHIAAKKKEEDK